MFWEAVELPDMVKKESGCSFHCNRCVRWNEVYSLGNGIHNGHDSVMSGEFREFDHKINTEGISLCIRNGERLELANWRVLPRFGPEA